MPQLGDLHLLLGDQGPIVGRLGAGDRQFGLDPQRPRRRLGACDARGAQRRLQRVDIVRQGLAGSDHADDGITNSSL